jgi:hypothetical protein
MTNQKKLELIIVAKVNRFGLVWLTSTRVNNGGNRGGQDTHEQAQRERSCREFCFKSFGNSGP